MPRVESSSLISCSLGSTTWIHRVASTGPGDAREVVLARYVPSGRWRWTGTGMSCLSTMGIGGS